MATFKRQLGIAFGSQSTEGTADATIAALSGALGLTDGIILGDAASGLVKSGITHGFERRLRENSPVSGSFTEQSGDFLEEKLATFTFAFPMSGSRQTTSATPVDADFEHDKGIKALLGACGLVGAASVSTPTVGWDYTPADVSIATAKIFDSGMAWVIRDVRGSWSLSQEPGEVGIMTCTLTGIVDSFSAAVTFPTFSYGVQSSVNAPSVQSVSPLWGGISRGWTALTIACDNVIETLKDAASSTGEAFEQTGRVITIDMDIRDDDSNIDYTREQLVLTSAPTDDLTETVGAAASGSDAALAYQIECRNIEVLSFTPSVAGSKASSNVKGKCTATTDGGEFSLAFL